MSRALITVAILFACLHVIVGDKGGVNTLILGGVFVRVDRRVSSSVNQLAEYETQATLTLETLFKCSLSQLGSLFLQFRIRNQCPTDVYYRVLVQSLPLF